MKISGGGFGSAVDLTAGADLIDAGDGTTLLKWSGQADARGPDRGRRRTRARCAGQETDRAGVWQCPPAVLDLIWPNARECPGSHSASDSFRCINPPMWIVSLTAFPWCVIFKAGTSDKTFDAWLVAQKVLEPRVDVAVGFAPSSRGSPRE